MTALERPTGDLELVGRVRSASNATFVGRLDDVQVVYKPVAGEQPLWDFPDGTLAGREVASYLVSEALGWRIVPPTWLGDGPHGPGMLQHWREIDPDQEAVTVVAADAVPADRLHVFDGLDAAERPVSLVHEDTSPLRRMALFDVVVNNADRKGGHVLEMSDGHRHGIDHGLTFHAQHKLRTVLWGWLGQPLTPDERAGLERLKEALPALRGPLSELVSEPEIEALEQRTQSLLRAGTFPAPSGDMPPIPWPPF